MINKIVFSLAVLFTLHRPATAQVAQDVQSLVDNVQNQARYYAQPNGSTNSVQQSIGQVAYTTPYTELMETDDIKRLMNAPNLALGNTLMTLKNIVKQYQVGGQPVKAKVINVQRIGNEVHAHAQFFPEVIEQVRIYDANKVPNLERKTAVIYVFDANTGDLTGISSKAYNQALQIPPATLSNR